MRKDICKALIIAIKDLIDSGNDVSRSISLWESRIKKEAILPIGVVSYLDNINEQCRNCITNLRRDIAFLRVLGTQEPESLKTFLERFDIPSDIKDAKELLTFYRAGLEPFLYQRTDPARASLAFTFEALLLFINNIYHRLNITGLPMPLFSETLSVDVFREAYKIPTSMQFRLERWPVCLHEVAHKVLDDVEKRKEALSAALMSSLKKDIASRFDNESEKQAIHEKWAKMDAPSYLDELFADVLATIVMGPLYFRASLDMLRDNPFSRLYVAQSGDALLERERPTHPPQELRFEMMLFTLEMMGYSSASKLWKLLKGRRRIWSQGFDFMMRVSSNPRTDPMGGFFKFAYDRRDMIYEMALNSTPYIRSSVMSLEKFQDLPNLLKPFLNPLESLEIAYESPDKIPSPFVIIAGIRRIIAEWKPFIETIRLRALRLIRLKESLQQV